MCTKRKNNMGKLEDTRKSRHKRSANLQNLSSNAITPLIY